MVIGPDPPPDLRTYVHIADDELTEFLETQSIGRIGDTTNSVEFFDVFAISANAMLDTEPRFVAADWGADERLLVVGCGEFGKHLVVEAARRFRVDECRSPLQITILDRDADRKINQLTTEHPELNRYWQLEGWSGDLAGPEFDRGAYLDDQFALKVRAISTCFDDEHLALTTCLTLQKRFDGIPIKVRMPQQDEGLATLLLSPANIRPFGLFEAACTPKRLFRREREA